MIRKLVNKCFEYLKLFFTKLKKKILPTSINDIPANGLVAPCDTLGAAQMKKEYIPRIVK